MTARKLMTFALVVLLGFLALGSSSTVAGATATDALNASANSYRDSFAQGTISTVVGSETDVPALPAGVSADWWGAVQKDIRQAEHSFHALRLTIDDSSARYPITLDSLATSPNWTVEGDQYGAGLGIGVSTAGDVNGDGYADVIVGAGFYDSGQTDEGRVFVYYGSASGLSSTADWMAESDQPGAYFGYSLDTAGDVNGDGYDEVIIGAHGGDKAYVFYGSAAGLPDADGDGLAHPNDANWIAQSDQPGTWFGYESSTAGDVNGDGYDEVMVAAALYTNGQFEEGRAFLYYGSASGLSPTADWMVESDLFRAHSFANGTAGDVNGDGYDDIIVGAHYSEADRAFVFYGSAAGLADADGDGLAHPSDADWTARSDQQNSRFGTAVGTAGDVNGDGYADVIIGDNFYENGQMTEGRAFVYYGSATGLPDADGDGVAYPSDANWMAESDLEDALFGRGVGTAGDVNGDGYDDVIISAPRYGGEVGDENAEGAAFVYHGSASGLPDADADGIARLSDADWTTTGGQDGASLGAVGTAGDVNGDGYADVIVGAWQYDSGGSNEGAAFVYHGSAMTIDVPCQTEALINAINTANSDGEPTTLNLEPGCIYTLTAVANDGGIPDGLPPAGLPSITSQIIINGNGATIERSSAGGIPEFRIFYVVTGGELKLNDLTLQKGFAPGSGGAILNSGGALELHNSTVSGNKAEWGDGGGIYSANGTVRLIHSTIDRNRAYEGGGIFNANGTAELTNSVVSRNLADGSPGGGIYNRGTVRLANSTVSGNNAAEGGGVFNASGTAELSNSTVSGNSSLGGGGIHNRGMLRLTNSTVSGNGAYHGGGIENAGGTVELTNSTVCDNSDPEGGVGVGISNSGGTVKLANTIVALNTSGRDCTGTLPTSQGHNLDSDGTCNLTAAGDLPNTDPLLGPLQDNGGPTFTHALLPGSPAIDAGDDSGCPATDQRGVPRPQEAACDIGAYEYEPPPNTAPVAVDDTYVVIEDNILSVAAPGVLDNDDDVDGDPLTAVLVSDVSNGTLSFNTDGSFTYTPNADFFGTDTFTYQANDGNLDSNQATVTIQVLPVNDTPVAADDAYSVDEDNTLDVPAPGVLDNDGDVDGDPLTAVLVNDVSHGVLNLNPDGSFTYAPDANFFGTDTFTYQASDGEYSSQAMVTITVNSVNDPPAAVDDEAATDQDVPLTIDVLANDFDVEGDALTVVSVTQGANGSVVNNGDGTVTYTRNPSFNGTDSFTYTIDDGNGGTASATVKVTITPDVDVGPGVILGDGVVIDPGATIKSGAVIGDGATIGSDVTISENVTVGEGATVEEGAVLKSGASLGAGSTLSPGAQLGEGASVGSDSQVGSGSQLKPGASVGDGAQIGDNVTLGENVTAGDNFLVGDGTTVKLEASLGSNVTLGSGVVVGKYVIIGDGVSVGDGTEIQESTTVGNDVTLGSYVTIGKSVKIGDGVSIGDQTTVQDEAILLGNDIILGTEVVIGKSVVIGDWVSIGDRTQVNQGTSIGADTSIGSDGLIKKQVQIGARVIIGSNVTVEANAVIPDDTVIPDGATVP